MNTTNLTESAPGTLPRINLRRTLQEICSELISSGGFQLVEIFQWDQSNDRAITLADNTKAAYISTQGERYLLSDYSASAEALTTNKITFIASHEQMPELEWAREYGLNSLLLVPILSGDNIIGLAEIASSDGPMISGKKTIKGCEALILKISSSLKMPLESNSAEDLFNLTDELKKITNSFSCSLSSWQPGAEALTLVIDDSSAYWDFGSGPSFPLKEWMSAKMVLEKNLPTVMYASDPKLFPEELEDMEEFKSLTKVIIPLTIGNRPIGFIDISNVETERSIDEEELFSWGALAGQAALAIQNAQLTDMAQEIVDEQTALRQSIEIMSSTVDCEVIIKGLTEQLGKAADATRVSISEVRKDFQSYKHHACYFRVNEPDEQHTALPNKHLPLIGNRSFREKLQSGTVIKLDTNDQDIAPELLQYLDKQGFKSALYLPIFIRGVQFGFAEIGESRPQQKFTQNKINLCKSMCLQASVAIENADLYRKAQDEIKLRKQLEQKLRHEALHDPLTKLPNRRLFIDRLEQAILRRSRHQDYDFSVLYVDLDKFKEVNDSFGHKAGDSVLIQISDTLRDFIRKSDTAARFGGDEFLILIDGPEDSDFIERICREIQSGLQSSISINGRQIPMSASIGLVTSAEEINSADEYINRADIAMYDAKAQGGSNVVKFGSDNNRDDEARA